MATVKMVDHSNRGKGFEDIVKVINDAYHTRQIANIRKCYTESFFNGRTKKWTPVRSQPDFAGYTIPDGKTIIFEVKKHEGNTLRTIPDKRVKTKRGYRTKPGQGTGLKEHQYNDLITCGKEGCLSFLLWMRGMEVKLFTWEMLPKIGQSIKWADGIPVEQGKGFILYDFLAVIMKEGEKI